MPCANSLDSPLYSEAVYGIRKMKMMSDAPIFSALLPKRLPKNSGMVAALRCCVMMRVLRPSTAQASSEPISALPTPDPGRRHAIFPAELPGIANEDDGGKIRSAIGKRREPRADAAPAQNEPLHICRVSAAIDADARP